MHTVEKFLAYKKKVYPWYTAYAIFQDLSNLEHNVIFTSSTWFTNYFSVTRIQIDFENSQH